MKLSQISYKAAVAVIAFSLSYYILMARQTIPITRAIEHAQFWYMLVLGAGLLYGYFRYAKWVGIHISYTEGQWSFFTFLLMRLIFIVWIPQILMVSIMRLLFEYLGLDFEQSGYMDTEFFMVLLVFYTTALEGIVWDLYVKMKQIQSMVIQKTEVEDCVSKLETLMVDEVNNELPPVEPIEGDVIHHQVKLLLQDVVLVRVRKRDVVFFKDDGTCEVYLEDRTLVDALCANAQMLTINRWTCVNRVFIQSVQKIDRQERVVLDDKLEQIYATCKTFNEPYYKGMENPKSILFISRTYKKQVAEVLKEGDIN